MAPRPLLRPPGDVMKMSRMGAAFPTRLSFMRSLVRRMARERWEFRRIVWDIDKEGYGRAAWSIAMPSGTVSFAAFSNALAPHERTDRVIAEKWDASFVLVDGDLTADDLRRLEANVPLQEAGRMSAKELVLSRANKSVRLFDSLVAALAEGNQPDLADILSVGYLMRTTAVYGNGKFGLGDFPSAARHPELDGPYRAEMLCVYMIRHFQCELAEHNARLLGGARAVPLARNIRRALGIGNATGLGMAPFLIRHPILIHHWIAAREGALAEVLALETASPADEERFHTLLARAQAHAREWNVEDPRQQGRIETLRKELSMVASWPHSKTRPWRGLYDRATQQLSVETQELIVALLIELYPAVVDRFEEEMGSAEVETIDGKRKVGDIRDGIENDYGWALAIDFGCEAAQMYFWYYSEAKDEPRLGRRFADPGAEREMRLGIGKMVKDLHAALQAEARNETIAAFLLRHPQWRLAVRRVETARRYPYSEIRDNTIGADLLPIDLLRCKLAFFGATKFDPKSDLWTRITMFQGAPLIDELSDANADDWWLPAWLS